MIIIQESVISFIERLKASVKSFVDRLKPSVVSFIERLKNVKKVHKIVALCVAVLLVATVTLAVSGLHLAYNVVVDGKSVATVSSKAVYEQGVDKACEMISGSQSNFDTGDIKATLSFADTDIDATAVATAILNGSLSVCNGYAISIDGQAVAFVSDKSVAETLINNRLNQYNIEGAECVAEFAYPVAIDNAYFHINAISDAQAANDMLANLDVITTITKTTNYTVPFETVTKKTSSKLAGYVKVTTSGVNGEATKTVRTVLLNGEVTEEELLNDTVLVVPVSEVVIVGTGKASYSSSIQNASASGFLWPLSTRGVITSYWGDGRNHGGIDIGVPSGTSVIAVKGGTVVEEGYRSDYGYYIVIDHGNGVKTKYAHNKANSVSVGQYVSAGQVIALSGNSGRSTGPHLHFEVIINGNRVNPAAYVGL